MNNLLTSIKTFFQNLFQKIGQVLVFILGIATTVFAALFVIEKAEKDSDEALIKDNKIHDQLNQMDQQIQQNDEKLKAESQKQEDLKNQISNEEKEKPDAKEMVDFFNNQSDQ